MKQYGIGRVTTKKPSKSTIRKPYDKQPPSPDDIPYLYRCVTKEQLINIINQKQLHSINNGYYDFSSEINNIPNPAEWVLYNKRSQFISFGTKKDYLLKHKFCDNRYMIRLNLSFLPQDKKVFISDKKMLNNLEHHLNQLDLEKILYIQIM